MSLNGSGPRAHRDESVFVALERGATWPERLRACNEGHAGTAVVVQGPGESPARFARRCAARLGQLDAVGHALGQAVLVLGSALDGEVRFARMAIAQALVRRMASEPDPTLIFALSAGLPDASRHSLQALVRSLDLLGVEPVRVRVHAPNSDAAPLSAHSRALLVEVQA